MAGLFRNLGDDSLLVVETPPVEEFSGDHVGFYTHNPVSGEQEIIDAYSWALIAEAFSEDAESYALLAFGAVAAAEAHAAAASDSEDAAAISAQAAAASEAGVEADALAAQVAANAAEDAELAAQGYASSASGSASAASGSASTASGHASAASSSASLASGYASAALGHADDASGFAVDAENFSIAASGYADAAALSAAAAATFDPASFYAKADGVPWADVNTKPDTATRWPAWSEVTSKPTAFTPTSHGHTWGELSGIPDFASRWPAWSEVTSKPTTFAPSAHNHAATEITSGTLSTDRLNFAGSGLHVVGSRGRIDSGVDLSNGAYQDSAVWGLHGSHTNQPINNNYGTMLVMRNIDTGTQVHFPRQDLRPSHRGWTGTTFTPWRELAWYSDLATTVQDHTVAPATTGAKVMHADGVSYDVGMNVMPSVTLNQAYTFARAQIGKSLYHAEATARTWTTPASSDTTIPLGSVFNIVNYGAGALTIARGSGTALYWMSGSGVPADGNRTLGQGGVATLWRSSAGGWFIWGNGGLT